MRYLDILAPLATIEKKRPRVKPKELGMNIEIHDASLEARLKRQLQGDRLRLDEAESQA